MTAPMKWRACHASRPHPAETANGDVAVVRQEQGAVLVAIVDGLGHGIHANAAAATAASFLHTVSMTLSAETMCRRLHDALRGTRGVVATIVYVTGDQLHGCGVGNVELRTVGATVSAVLNPGILGVRALRFRAFEAVVSGTARLHLFSDGISSRFDPAKFANLPLEEACQQILQQWSKPTDDASILILENKT